MRGAVRSELVAEVSFARRSREHRDSGQLIANGGRATPTITIPDNAFSFSHLPEGQTVWLAGTGGPKDVEKVQIDLNWDLMTPLIASFFPNGKLTLRVSSSMKNEPRFQ